MTISDEDLMSLGQSEIVSLEKDHPGSIGRWHLLHDLKRHQEEFQNTDMSAHLMLAIYKCGVLKIPLPEWIVDAFRSPRPGETVPRINKIIVWMSNSWDEVLGKPFGNKAHLGKKHRDARLKTAINDVIHEQALGSLCWDEEQDYARYKFNVPVDDALFETIASNLPTDLKVKATKVKEIYYEHLS